MRRVLIHLSKTLLKRLYVADKAQSVSHSKCIYKLKTKSSYNAKLICRKNVERERGKKEEQQNYGEGEGEGEREKESGSSHSRIPQIRSKHSEFLDLFPLSTRA